MLGRIFRTAGVFSFGAATGVGALAYAARRKRDLEAAAGSSVALIRMSGVIDGSPEKGFATSTINAKRYGKLFEAAFKLPGVKAVALVINSPGGSPTQSALIFKHLMDLRQRYPNVPLLAFVEDYAASGGYYIACAANEIIADETSMVGSIGVIRASFGFPELMKTYGFERRVQTAGLSKNKLDPFLPETDKDRAFAGVLLATLHATFIQAVKQGRGPRLRPAVAADLALAIDPESEMHEGLGLFDGSVYIGQAARDVGLIDHFGEHQTYLRARFEPSRVIELKPRQEFFQDLMTQLGISASTGGLLASIFRSSID